MSILPLTVALLMAGGSYLLLQASMVRIIFGITLLSHGANLMLLAAGVSAWRTEPLATTEGSRSADPLPMAFVLTAIVITLAVTVLMLALARIGGDDDTYHVPDTGEDHHA